MDLFDRVFKLHGLLSSSRYPVSRAKIQTELECSRATVNRIIRKMKDYLGAPIAYDRAGQGYSYSPGGEHLYELPGLWFNASELHALLASQRLLAGVQPGLLEEHLAPLSDRIEHILRVRRAGGQDISLRVRLLGQSCRRVNNAMFCKVADALLKRKRLRLTYHSRFRNQTTRRTVSPQRLVHYRDNWYLDAWDHGKRALRSFALERIREAGTLKARANNIPDKQLDDYFVPAYGIFAGPPKHTARLRFSAERSRWVAEEIWHPAQKGRFEKGCYVLEVPYSDSRELVMDILKHGPHVEVLGPALLRREVVGQMEQALKRQRPTR